MFFFLLHPPTAAHVVVCVEVHYCVVKCTTFSCTWWSMCITGVVLDRECDDLKYIYIYVRAEAFESWPATGGLCRGVCREGQ